MLGPVLEGKLVTLAPLDRANLENYCRWSNDRQCIRYLLIQHPLTIEQEQTWFERIAGAPDEIVWEIRREGRHIGSIGLHRIDWRNQRATGGIWIGESSAHGKGFGSEAMALRTRYAFHDLGLHKVMTSSLVANVASRRAALSAGYRECGCLRRHLYRDGQWHDEWLGEVLRDEWETTWLPAHS